MTVPEKTLKIWIELRSEKDTKKIATNAGVSTVTIQTAFNTGVCNDEVFEAMAKFYNAKAKRVKKLLLA